MSPKTNSSSNLTPPIRLINATFSWSSEGPPVIKDVSLELRSGTLTMVVGPVGSGKSSLLKGILGEIPSSKGFVHARSSQTAFVQQTPWIQQKTIRETILGISVLDQLWYDRVVHACALDRDIAELPQADLTLVGPAGHSLSGGQRQRLALARAVYSRCSVLILNDPFSGLDAENEDAIFNRLLGTRGLLRQLGVTVVLVTHAAHRLSNADHIIALNAEGDISEQGAFPEMLSTGGYVSVLAARHENHDKKGDENNQSATQYSFDTKPTTKTPKTKKTEETIRPLGDIRVYQHYFTAAGWMNTAAFFVMIASFAFFSRFPDLWMKFWTAAVARHGNSVNTRYLGVFVALGFITMICVLGVAFHVFTRMVPTSARKLHAALLSTVIAAPLSFFTSTRTGQTLNRFSQDMNLVDNEFPFSLIQVSGPLFLGIIQAVLICLSAAYFATTLPVVLVVMYFLQKYYLHTSQQIRLLDIEANAPLYSHFLETLQGLVTIRAFGWTDQFQQQNIDLLDKSQKPFYLLFCIQRWLTLVLDLIVAALAVILMVMVIKLRETLDPGLVALALLNVMSFNNNLTAIIQMWTALETSLGAISRLKTFGERTHSENLPLESATVPSHWPANGSITFSNLSATYDHSLPDAIKQINLYIAPGSKIALVGPSGSGKSSVVASLFRLLEITAGSISIDGIDLSTLPRSTIRSRLTAIPQEAFFLKGTIRENIDPLNQYTPSSSSDNTSTIETALRKVNLWPTISNTTLGLDSPMDPESLFSIGQQQLFALARSLVRHAHSPSPIIVLDEPTASVDLETDELVQRIIREEFKGCTIFTVAHRLKTIMDFDLVVVMKNGGIVEVGEPRVLREVQGGMFKEMCGVGGL